VVAGSCGVGVCFWGRVGMGGCCVGGGSFPFVSLISGGGLAVGGVGGGGVARGGSVWGGGLAGVGVAGCGVYAGGW